MEQKESRLISYVRKGALGFGIIGMSYIFSGCESMGNNIDSSGIVLFRIEKNFGEKGVRKSGVFYDMHEKHKKRQYNNY